MGFKIRNKDQSNFDKRWWSLYYKSFQYSFSFNFWLVYQSKEFFSLTNHRTIFIILVYMTVVVLWTTQDISKGLALLQIQDIDFPYEFRIFILVHWISGILDLETSSVFNLIKNKCFMCNSNSRSLASNPRTLPWEFLEIIGFSR